MDKFYTNTLTQRYINNLLQSTDIPIVDFVRDGDFIIKDAMYIYAFQYIVCTQTGNVGDTASFEVIEPYYAWQPHIKYTRRFTNIDGFYSKETHRKLGDYLRAFYSNGGVNLMGMYNCHNCTSADNICIDDNEVVQSSKDNHKITLVPIKFNKPYTVSLESKSQFRIAPVLYSNGNLVYIYDDSNALVDATNTYLQNVETKALSSFNAPWLFSVNLSSTLSDKVLKQLYDRQGDLYLMIETIFSNQSTLIVLEGDYIEKQSADIDSGDIYYQPLLQMYNTDFDIPYSDNLIQYLTHYAIFSDEGNEWNVRKLREKLGLDPRGDYDDEVREMVYQMALQSLKTFKADIYGYVDSNVERVIKV